MAHLLENILPIDSIKLGRLLLNPKEPQQDFIDPLDPRPEAPEINQNDQQILRLPKNPKIPPYLASIASVSISHVESAPLTTTLTVLGATSYDLKKPTAWFTAACSRQPTRQFLEEAFDNQEDVYFIIGLRTIKDPGTTGVELQGRVLTPSSTMSGIVEPGLGHPLVLAYTEPREQIFAVLYCKVEFRYLSSLYVNTLTLEQDNRWVSNWCWRGPVQQYELAEEDNVIEARLMDLDDTTIFDEKDSPTGNLMEWAAGLTIIGQMSSYIPSHKKDSMKRIIENGVDDKASKRPRSNSTVV